ncbi:tetratricopeptide repeat protein [bacterium]|nr:tetratricopeptide repeat protein [bacterium]
MRRNPTSPPRPAPPGAGARPRLTAALQAGATALALALALLLAWHPLEDLDIWFHLRAGTDLAAGGPLPAVNAYSFTEPTHPWLNHEWLFQFLVHATASKASLLTTTATGWNLLRAALAAAIVLTLALGDGGRARFRGGGTPAGAVAAGLALAGALALLWPRLLLRPELLSYLALVLLVRAAEAWRAEPASGGTARAWWRSLVDPRSPGGRVFWLIVVWAQCHGFSAVSPLLVAIALIDPLPGSGSGDRRPIRWRTAASGLVVGFMALLATPNGWRGLAFPLRALGQFGGDGAGLQGAIAELTPLLRSPGMLAFTIDAYIASLVVGAFLIVTGWRRLGLLRVLLWLGLAAAALAGQRAVGPYAIAFALLALRWAPPAAWRSRLTVPRWPALAGATALVAAAAAWGGAIRSDAFYLAEGVTRRTGGGLATAQYPVAAAAALSGQAPQRVFANLGASGLLLGAARSPVYIDGRTEAYSPAHWREYLTIRRGGEQALALLDAQRVDAVCLAGPAGPFARLLRDLLESPRWQVVIAEGAGVLLRREHLPPGPEALPRQQAAKRAELTRGALAQEQASLGLSPARAADALVAAAALHGLAGDDRAARACLERAAAGSPRHALARHNLGNRYLSEGRFEAALAEFTAAARANRRLAPPRLNAGVCLMRLGRPVEAARRFEQAARLDPRAVEPWANLALARQAAGDTKGALDAVERALSASPADRHLAALRDDLRRGRAPAGGQ